MLHHHLAVGLSGVLACLVLTAGAVAAAPAPVSPEPDSERPCFMVRSNWNEGLDGPQPTC